MAATTTKKTFVLYPSLGVGHLTPMVELAKRLLQYAGVGVVIAVADPPDVDAVSAAAVARLTADNPAIAFHLLPVPPANSPADGVHPVKRSNDTLRRANPALRDLLRTLPAVDALLLDMFCVHALDVAAELRVPAYFFFAASAGALAVLLHLPHLYPTLPSSLREMGSALVPGPGGMPPVRALDMPGVVLDRGSDATKVRMHQFTRIPEGAGVLVNTFEWLEPGPLKALRDGACVPTGWTMPRVYCVGPMVDDGGKKQGDISGHGQRHECLAWLDAQPARSVVFLCFGSMGAFPGAQLREIAHGLESSGHRFLWAVRSPPEEQRRSLDEADLERLLPEGFLDRTRGRGMVVRNWVPQAEVVRSAAVGAFVTHCGWNSVLEAVSAGLPMVCWPLYAEQRLNKVFMVEEMKVAVEMKGYEDGFVKAEEVDAKVKLVMETEEGRVLRERLAVARDRAREAVEEGGPSEMAFAEFLSDLEKSSS